MIMQSCLRDVLLIFVFILYPFCNGPNAHKESMLTQIEAPLSPNQ